MRPYPLLYFVSGKAEVPAYVQDGTAPLTRRAPAEGPDAAAPGTLLTPCPMTGPLEYDAARQRWVKIEQGDACSVWLGVDTVERLKPQDVARRQQKGGHPVTLGDGQAWVIPCARLAFGGSGLPRRRVLDDDGRPAWKVEPAFQELSDWALRLWNSRQGLSDAGLTEDALDRIVGLALAVNYRIAEREAMALGLLTDSAIRGIVDALLDWPTVEQVLLAEKKTPGTAGS